MSAPRLASRTAIGTAYLRAAHQLLDAAPRILDDPLAVPILGAGAERHIMNAADRYRGRGALALRSHVVLRARVAEDRLREARARGISQYVVLGAGYDTFAYRQPDGVPLDRIVEVDQPATQAAKLASLHDAAIALPSNVTHAAIDFEHTGLGEGLAQHGVSADTPTFFSWLGVTMYLTREAVADTLGTLAAFRSGSEVVLTFAQPADEPSRFEQRSAALGETWLSHYTVEEMAHALHDAGFGHVTFLTNEDATQRYFANRPDDLPPPTRISIVSAIR